MNQIKSVLISLVWTALCWPTLAGAMGESAGEPTHLNIVLIVSDDHGREALGSYGNPRVATPNLDRLAQEGTRFTNAYCTSASCSPSRATILTGLQPYATGMYGLSHSVHPFYVFDKVKTLPEMLSAAGYRTRRVGKAHYAPMAKFPFEENEPERAFNRNDVAAADSCRSFIRGQEPFFLYFCSFNPHRDGRTVDDNPWRPDSFGNPKKAFPGDTEQVFSPDEVIAPPFLNDTPEARAELAQYYQSIARLDRGVGRLLTILQEEGKYEQTVIIYVTDNGAAFPGAKTTLYEPGIRLPCIVRDPGQAKRGVVNDALISWVDLTPTILDFAQALPPNPEFHGKSFRAILEESSPRNWRESVYAAHSLHEITNYYPMRSIRTSRYKFIWNLAAPLAYPFASDLWLSATWQQVIRSHPARFGARPLNAFLHRPTFELYDLDHDPDESVNLAPDPAYQDLLKSFQTELRQFQEKTRDPWLHKWIYE